MGPEGEPDTKMNWSTDRRPQDNRNSTQEKPSRTFRVTT
jgi:hypothetical protein